MALRDVGSADPSEDQREKWAKKGIALPDGSYPIPNKDYLVRAIKAYGRSKPSERSKVKAHIVKRAKALDASDKVMQRAKELGQSVELAEQDKTATEAAGGSFDESKHLRSPLTGQFIPKNQTAARILANERVVEAALTKMGVGETKKLPDELGWVEKTKSGFIVVGPGGTRSAAKTAAGAQEITSRILKSALGSGQ